MNDSYESGSYDLRQSVRQRNYINQTIEPPSTYQIDIADQHLERINSHKNLKVQALQNESLPEIKLKRKADINIK